MVNEQQEYQQQQQLIASETPDEPALNATLSQNVHKPEDILDHLGARHRRLVLAIVSCSFVWCFGAVSIMASAFTSIDCGNCTDSMQTIVSEVVMMAF
uniref:Transmembrane protein n=1 Tax=Angiostrongylus cantonensis TaxID=6313 RepID=A0A0K0DLN6_ANGCA